MKVKSASKRPWGGKRAGRANHGIRDGKASCAGRTHWVYASQIAPGWARFNGLNPLKRSRSAPSPEAAADFLARLLHHPQLYVQMTALLDEVENRAGTLNTGDEAEDAIVARVREVGHHALSGWAERRHGEVQPARTPGRRQAGKKNSGG